MRCPASAATLTINWRCPAAFEKHDGAVLMDGTFTRFLLTAFPPPNNGPTSGSAPITHLGPGRVSLALSLVTPSQNGFSWFM